MSRSAKTQRKDSAPLPSTREPVGSPFAPPDFAATTRRAKPPSASVAGSLLEDYLHQRRVAGAPKSTSEPAAGSTGDSAAPRKNETGMPDALKAGIESLSGLPMDDVKVHYNSPRPARVQALAYTRGSEIHIASGQERHLPHEAWHAVQQKQERVRPTGQVAGLALNDDPQLEKEADVMGAKASRMTT